MLTDKLLKRIMLLFVLLVLPFAAAGSVSADTTAVTLTSLSPSSGQAGISNIVVHGTGFPRGIHLKNLTVQLTPTGGGSAVTAQAMPVGKFPDPEQRVSFIVPSSISVDFPAEYTVSLSGSTFDNVQLSSSNTLALTINPPPTIALAATSGAAGQTIQVDITGAYTNFSKKITAANFGPGISVGKGSPGGWGLIKVNSATSATAIIKIDASAAMGERKVTVRTGVQDASAAFIVESASTDTSQSAAIDAELANDPDIANSAATYTITDLGTFGGSESRGDGINDIGQVTGYADTSSGYAHAFIYSGGTMTDLGTLFGAWRYGLDINNSGQVTGYCTGVKNDTFSYRGFIYSGGTMTALGTLGGNYSVGTSINDSGQVAGYAEISTSGYNHAFLYNGGTMTDLGTLGGYNSSGSGINNSGQVTGSAQNSYGYRHAFLYTGGTMTDLGTLGGDNSYGADINNAGQVTGYTETIYGCCTAFIYSGGTMTDIDTLNDGLSTYPAAINDLGQVVGYTGNASTTHAFLYNSGSITYLDTLLPNGSDWHLWYAKGINNSGQITGYGQNASGKSHAFLLSPPQPTHFTVSVPSSSTSGSALSLTVTALDASNNTATGYTGTVHFTSSDPAATLPSNATLTNGVGTFSATLKTVGSQTITATDTATSTITGTSGSVVVSAASATHFTVSAPSSSTSGSALSLTVTALDASNNTATGYTGTVHFTSSDPAATLPSNATLTNGVGTFSATLKTVGSQTITATDTATSTITGTSGSITVSSSTVPDLTITKTHKGNFKQGQKNATYTIKVTNSGKGATAGSVTVTDTLPAGLKAASMTGSGWSCTLDNLTCMRSSVLKTGKTYPPITLKVNVAADADASVINTVTVSGGGETDTTNDTATDTTVITPVAPDLTITKKHSGKFKNGKTGTYTIKVTNSGNGPTSGEVKVVDALPSGLTVKSIAGSGWTCDQTTLACTRSSVLKARASYPPITLKVNVNADTGSSLTNSATVSGGGERARDNDTATDTVTVY